MTTVLTSTADVSAAVPGTSGAGKFLLLHIYFCYYFYYYFFWWLCLLFLRSREEGEDQLLSLKRIESFIRYDAVDKLEEGSGRIKEIRQNKERINCTVVRLVDLGGGATRIDLQVTYRSLILAGLPQ